MKNIMNYKGYHARIDYDDEDCIFLGEVLGINDVLTFHGETPAELKQHFKDCIENYFNACKEAGKNPEREYTGSFSVRIEPEEQRIAAVCAEAAKISFNQYIGKAVKAYNRQNYKNA